jgi:cell division transport system permease protein
MKVNIKKPNITQTDEKFTYFCTLYSILYMSSQRKPTQFYATMSTSIVLVLISLFLLIFFHSNNITNIVKENINILVELEDRLPSGQIENLKKIVASYKGVVPSSVTFLTKESALALMSAELNISQSKDENPFKDIIKFNLNHESYSEETIREIKAGIELEKGVIGLYYENESVDAVKKNLDKVSLGILILAFCFIVLALAIIFNTIQLTLHSDTKEIKTMQMVGAENSFIKKPYLKAAFWMSTKAVITVIVFIAALCIYLIQSSSIFAEIIQWKFVALTIFISFLVAFFIQLFSTNAIINRYLRKEGR